MITSRVAPVYPAFNPFMILLNTSLKNREGFQYLVDIYNAETNTLVRSLKLQPNPVDNNYGITDLSRIMANNIQGDVTLLPWSYCGRNSHQYFPAKLSVGYEYLYEWDFKDNYFNSTPPYAGRVGFTGNTAHEFEVGDSVIITQSGTPTNALYDGVHTVVQLPYGDTHFTVNYPFLTATSPEGGTVTYLDLRRKQYKDIASATTVFWDGVIRDTYDTYDWEDNFMSGSSKFLTIINNAYKVRRTNNGFFNIILAPTVTAVQVEVSDGTIGRQFDSTTYTAATTSYMLRIPFAPASVNAALGYDFLSAATSYTLTITDPLENILSESKSITIDDRCTPDKDKGWTEIIFEDRLSSYIPINFRYMTKEESAITRKSHKRALDYSLDGDNNYIYLKSSQANKIYTINTDKTISVHTGYISQAESLLVEGLLKSKNVYWRDGDDYIPVLLTDSSFMTKTKQRNAVEIDYTITFIPQIYGDVNI